MSAVDCGELLANSAATSLAIWSLVLVVNALRSQFRSTTTSPEQKLRLTLHRPDRASRYWNPSKAAYRSLSILAN